MKVLIIYATRTGFTAECALRIKECLSNLVDLYEINKINPKIFIEDYDLIILGSSIQAGRIQSKLKKFIKKHQSVLCNKKLALFITCLENSIDKFFKYFTKNFPQELLKKTKAKTRLGGAIYYEKLDPLSRFILKRITGINKSFSAFDEQALRDFVSSLENNK